MNAESNVELPLMVTPMSGSERKKKADALLTGLGLGHRLKQMATNLSGGEQQRVALARALVNNPVLILADEPTGNLDTRSSDDVIKLLERTCKENGVTIVMVTHNLALTKHCDRVIHIKDGKIEREETLS
jgi:putative ABC transport system ATP-binding protein